MLAAPFVEYVNDCCGFTLQNCQLLLNTINIVTVLDIPVYIVCTICRGDGSSLEGLGGEIINEDVFEMDPFPESALIRFISFFGIS